MPLEQAINKKQPMYDPKKSGSDPPGADMQQRKERERICAMKGAHNYS